MQIRENYLRSHPDTGIKYPAYKFVYQSLTGSLPSLSTVDDTPKKKTKNPMMGPGVLSDFDARYLGALDDYDELEDIQPGSLTLSTAGNVV